MEHHSFSITLFFHLELFFYFNLVHFFISFPNFFLAIIQVIFELVKSIRSYRDNSHIV